MTKYRKKPVVIEAFCLGRDFMPDWFMDKVTSNDIILRNKHHAGYRVCEFDIFVEVNCSINTLEGVMQAYDGDYIIKGVNNEIYPCKPDIFHKTYERVDE